MSKPRGPARGPAESRAHLLAELRCHPAGRHVVRRDSPERRRLKQAARQSVLAARLEGAPRRQTGQVWRLALDGQELGTPGLVQSRHGAQEPERVGMAWI